MGVLDDMKRASLAVEEVWHQWDTSGYARLDFTQLEIFSDVVSNINPALSVNFEVLSPTRANSQFHPLCIKFRIEPNNLCIFLPYDALSGAQSFRASAVRLIGTLALLAHLASRKDSLGLCLSLSLGDYAEGCDLAFSSISTSHLIPDSEFLSSLGYRSFRANVKENWVKWRDRENKIFWRGSTTGQQREANRIEDGRWYNVLQRVEACHILTGSQVATNCDVGISNVVQLADAGVVHNIYKHLVKDGVERSKQVKYRFQLDMDGNSNAWAGLFQALAMGSCVLKVGSERGFRQWYYDRMQPWVHFIPVAADLADLVEKAEWAIGHEAECENIANNAFLLASEMSFVSEIDRSTSNIIREFSS